MDARQLFALLASRTMLPTLALTALAFLACAPSPSGGADEVPLPAALHAFLSEHCLDCHAGPRSKANLDLAGCVQAERASSSLLASLRARLAREDMPPDSVEDRPTPADYAAAIDAVDSIVPPARREVPVVMRLNRWQYANSVRDALGLLGVDGAGGNGDADARAFADSLRNIALSLLPPDDVGEGFDTTGDTLALPPLLMDKYLIAAEAVALAALPPAATDTRRTIGGPELERDGKGQVIDNTAWLFTVGEVGARFKLPRSGRYTVRTVIEQMKAGPEDARAEIRVNGKAVTAVTVANTRGNSGTFEWSGSLAAGEQRITVAFLNDFYNPSDPNQSARDRNLGCRSIEVQGPIGGITRTPCEVALDAAAGTVESADTARLRRVAAALAPRLFRRAVDEKECAKLVQTARTAAGGAKSSWDEQLRALVTALLIDPRFLLRVEPPARTTDLAQQPGSRALTGSELASRLSFFLWASVPDDTLRLAADAGELNSQDGLARQVNRMLEDERASALADRFFAQWLGIDGLEARSFDPRGYPALSGSTLRAMQAETLALCGRLVRGELPLRSLLTTRETICTPELAQHYGLISAQSATTGGERSAYELPPTRPPGVLGHGSVLAATSNPNRTSPVKRGKWVLDVILDQTPPPPPPGVPQLPEGATNQQHLSMRQLMEQHRANPDCASCHTRMDAIGLAFERLDADGRLRSEADGVLIDDRSELPGGTQIDGPQGVAELLLEGNALERSLARRLMIYALGRGTAAADDRLIQQLAQHARAEGTFESLVRGIVLSDAFRTRREVGTPAGN